jgi:hypothetical protein
MDKIRGMRLRIVAGKSLQSVASPDYSALLVRLHHFVICRAPITRKHAEQALKEAVDLALEPFSSSQRSHNN